MQKRCFHSSVLSLGRKSGASAFVAAPRALSKKQTKRKATAMKIRIQNKSKEKTSSKFMSNQLASDDMKKFIAEATEQLKGAFDDLLLPDSTPRLDVGESQPKIIPNDPNLVLYLLRDLKAKENLLLSGTIGETAAFNPDSPPQVSGKILEAASETATQKKRSAIQVISDRNIQLAAVPDEYQLMRALTDFAGDQSFEELREVVNLMTDLKIKVSSQTWAKVMAACFFHKQYKLSEEYFDIMIESGVEPTPHAWTELVKAKALDLGPDAALEQLNILQRTGVTPTIEMFTLILDMLITENRHKDSNDLWIRMHWEECQLNTDSFTTIMKLCSKTGSPERAFFYLDEMRALHIKPDERTFAHVFRACAEAPHWVDGYHDIVFDAMDRMEGAEMRPTKAIYDAIIYAFSRCGDTVAAEFYFWEMKRKGLKVNSHTYSRLLFGFARAQTIGASAYGTSGRYVKPADKPLSQEDQDYVDVGATKVAKLMAQGITKDFNLERGSRQSTQLEDILDDSDPDAQEAFRQEIHEEANYLRGIRADLAQKEALESGDPDYPYHLGHGNIDFDELSKSDPELRKLMDGLADDRRKSRSRSSASAQPSNGRPEARMLQGQSEDGFSADDADRDLDEDEDFPLSPEEAGSEERAINAALKVIDDKESEEEAATAEEEEEEKEGDDESGYAEGEAQYAEWLKKNDLSAEEIQSGGGFLDSDEFSDADREFLRTFDLDQEIDKTKKTVEGVDSKKEVIDFNELTAMMKELGLGDELLKPKPTGYKKQDNIGQGKYVADRDSVTAAGMKGAEEAMDRTGGKRSRKPLQDGPPSGFKDRFEAELKAKKALNIESIELEGRRKQMTNLLDNDDDIIGDEFDRMTRAPGSELSTPDSYFSKKMQSYDPNTPTRSQTEHIKLYSDFTPADIAKEWDMIQFGRAPNPDYSMTVEERRDANVKRAKLIYEDLVNSGEQINEFVLNTYLNVYANATSKRDKQGYREKAMEVFKTEFTKLGIKPSTYTYRGLIRMHILAKDIDAALKLKDDMIKDDNVVPDAESYGWLIRSCGHRDLLVEGLQLLEEVTERGIKVQERHLQHLRARCATLGIVHPNMPADPLQWVADMKKMRKDGKNRSQRKMNSVRSALYGK